MPNRYLQLREHIGLTAGGNPEPLVTIGLTATVPRMRNGEIVDDPHRHEIKAAEKIPAGEGARIMPDTRIVEASDPVIADLLLSTGNWEEIDPPSKREQQHQRGEARAAKQEAGTHADPEDETTSNVGVKGE